jgi:CTP:molybdopterin cytidylyltransferase MocA
MGRVKALLPHPVTGLPLALHVTNTLRNAAATPLAIVTGVHHGAIAAALDGAPVTCLFNPRHADGQLASLQRALAWARRVSHAEWLLVTLVDVPAVSVATVSQLIAAARRSTAQAVRPAHDGHHGHPVLWRADVWPLLEAADLRVGARQVMHDLVAAGQVEDVAVADACVLRDLDTPEDYERFQRDHSG